MKFESKISKKKAENLMQKVAESANNEFVGRCYRYDVTPFYADGIYSGVALTRCDMDGRNSVILYVASCPD